MTVSTLTINERQSKLEALAEIDSEILANTTVKELRVMTAGVILNQSRLKKVELLQLIAGLTDDIRKANKIALEAVAIASAELLERNKALEAANMSPASLTGVRLSSGITNFNDIIDQTIEAIGLAAQKYCTTVEKDKLIDAVDGITFNYCHVQGISYVPTTRKSNLTRLKNALDDWLSANVNHVNADCMELAVARFKRQAGVVNYEQNKQITVEYNQSVKLEVNGRRNIASQPLLDEAVNVLTTLSNYRDVAIALAIVTGRRMGEILSVGRFELSSNPEHLLFSGISKGRGSTATNKAQLFDIPVLANPVLILNAFQYLEDNGHRPDDIKLVNSLYAKPLSRQMVKWSELSGQAMTYKSLRALYASICFNRYALETENENFYFSKILGHADWDKTTAFSYMTWNVTD